MRLAHAFLFALCLPVTVQPDQPRTIRSGGFACEDSSVIENTFTIMEAGARDGTTVQSAFVVTTLLNGMVKEGDCIAFKRDTKVSVDFDDSGVHWVAIRVIGESRRLYTARHWIKVE